MTLDDKLFLMAEYYAIPMIPNENIGALNEIYRTIGVTDWNYIQRGILYDYADPWTVCNPDDYSNFILLVREAIR